MLSMFEVSRGTEPRAEPDAGLQPPADAGLAKLQAAIDAAAALLPAQGPISAFVFLNSLQALEDMPFDDGLLHGSRLFGCEPYLPEDEYRRKLAEGRIAEGDLAGELIDELGPDGATPVVTTPQAPVTRLRLRLAMLRYALRAGGAHELRWFVAETDALTKIRAEVPAEVRHQILEETRHWVLRGVYGTTPAGSIAAAERDDSSVQSLIGEQLAALDRRSLDGWNDAVWERLALESLWRVCRQGVRGVTFAAPVRNPPVRHRDALLTASGLDADALVSDVLIRFCMAFTDQGLARWTLPERDRGFFRSFCHYYGLGRGLLPRWLRRLPAELARLDATQAGALESIRESLVDLGVEEENWEDYLAATVLALRGWAGIIHQMEVRGDRVALPAPAGTLIEFLAVRLVLDRLALAHLAQDVPLLNRPLRDWLAPAAADDETGGPHCGEQRAFVLFQLAQLLGWSAPAMLGLSAADWTRLVCEVEAFSSTDRRRIFHRAFERRYRLQSLDALSRPAPAAVPRTEAPPFQAVFCIDAREESFRRHLEEVAPECQTFGAAGFFGVAMYFRGVGDAHFAALCPIVVRPKHWVTEEVVQEYAGLHRRRARWRQALGAATHQIHLDSRGIVGGTVLTAGLGVLASIPLVMRVLFPRLTARLRRSIGQFVDPPRQTRLRLERVAVEPGPEPEQNGFSVIEMADIGERMLRDIGLTSRFARLVFFFGHGSGCLNNPHKSAYDCGACSGSAGAPNARVLAAMLNDPRVRRILTERGLPVPGETVFVGGLHNTCEDTIAFFDLDRLPPSHFDEFERARLTFVETCDRNAHERCRRFESASLDLSPEAAHRHVKDRSQDLAQPRPEFGNATNALCVVGRRELTQGLYLDRRCFLHSYDPLQDDAECSVLGRILGAVVPVCSGINLQYFFSAVDSLGWGSGSKLPHNIASLLGVMDGAASDLRSGLPWQGVEIHEPMRLLFAIEATPEGMQRVMQRNLVVRRILANGWAQLALIDPATAVIRVYRNGRFEPHDCGIAGLPSARSSRDWYRGWRGNLGIATIESSRSA